MLTLRKFLGVAAVAAATLITALCPAAESDEPRSASDVFDRYLAAVGGRDAFSAVKTRVTKAEFSIPTLNVSGKIENHQKAPNKYASTLTVDAATILRIFDGKTGWTKNPFGGGLKEETGIDLANLKLDAELLMPLRMAELFPKATLKGKERLENTDTYVVEAPAGDKTARLYFDAKTWFLVGWMREVKTQTGSAMALQKFDDYKEVNRVKIPFGIAVVTPELSLAIKVLKVEQNTDIPDAKFDKPSEN
jgi:zinc protease